ncbi:MAG: 16S rRNA (guanine(527)-N(7))-methyltransferase RsmG [Anaerolineaceae bacterium]|nr:16S rRNA (guanine(527)-N(7))-methyltransferase RsmG [Anaerolineaceae bacterium]
MNKFPRFIKSTFGIELTPSQVNQFAAYEKLLLEWNGKFNLTSIIDHDTIHVKHFIDSLTCLHSIPPQGNFSLIDIGTGAGFPGIPLKIINPSIKLTLVESIGKKANFCRIATEELQLKNVIVITNRAETIGQDNKYRNRYDWAVARAVAPLSILSEYLLPLVHIGGSMLAQKGSDVKAEINQAENAIKVLGGKLNSVIPITLPNGMGKRMLIHIRKITKTPSKYPRRPGTPKKSPL